MTQAALRRLRQEDPKFKTSQGCIANLPQKSKGWSVTVLQGTCLAYRRPWVLSQHHKKGSSDLYNLDEP
jgi:hypothetical protein